MQAVQVMTKICREAEASLDYSALFRGIIKRAPSPMSPLESLASSAVRTAHKVPAPPCACAHLRASDSAAPSCSLLQHKLSAGLPPAHVRPELLEHEALWSAQSTGCRAGRLILPACICASATATLCTQSTCRGATHLLGDALRVLEAPCD